MGSNRPSLNCLNHFYKSFRHNGQPHLQEQSSACSVLPHPHPCSKKRLRVSCATSTDQGQHWQSRNCGICGNGEATYIDSVMHPFPAIRFKEDVGDVAKLREKEKGDWKKMTLEEKKAVYRASFCQTLSEVEAPTGEW